MSLSVPSRRLIRGAPALTATPTTTTTTMTTTPSSLLPALQSLTLAASAARAPRTTSRAPSARRPFHTTPPNKWFWRRKKGAAESSSSLEQELMGTKDTREALVNQLSSRVEGPAIFDDELKETEQRQDQASQDAKKKLKSTTSKTGASLVREHVARAADPDPRSRVRWERKMVLRQLRRGTDPYSREPRAERIARTERQLVSRSTWLATSTKKLVMLARQIQGKTVADAIVQMRFSKKKMAQEVRYQLQVARDEAVALRGMGLGAAAAAADAAADAVAADAAAADAAAAAGNQEGDVGELRESSDHKTIEIKTKDGKWIKIDDPTRMYVAEAWVNRGPWRHKVLEYRARGRANVLHRPTASISVRLKEEKTRIREAAEREAKRLRQGPWVHLPDRPVTAQRQWYSW